MANLIKGSDPVADEWRLLDKDASFDDLGDGKVLVHVSLWQQQQPALAARGQVGLWFDSEDEPETVEADFQAFPVIAVNFPKFVDGRGYSIARILRDRFGFSGELRAIGDVLPDQLFYMKRCGFNAFLLADGKRVETALKLLATEAQTYQGATDERSPLFRRRQA